MHRPHRIGPGKRQYATNASTHPFYTSITDINELTRSYVNLPLLLETSDFVEAFPSNTPDVDMNTACPKEAYVSWYVNPDGDATIHQQFHKGT